MAKRQRPSDDNNDPLPPGEVDRERRNEIRRDLLEMDPEDIPEYIRELDNMAELQVANEWLIANGLSPVSDDLFDTASEVSGDTPLTAGPGDTEGQISADIRATIDAAQAEIVTGAGGEITDRIEDREAWDQARDDAADWLAEQYASGSPTIDDRGIDQFMPDGLGSSTQESWREAVRQQADEQWERDRRAGLSEGGTEGEDADAVIEGERSQRSLLGGATEPDWLLQLNGRVLSEQQKQRYVDYWNDAYGTYFRDFDRDLAPILSRFDGTEVEAQEFASAVLTDQEPLITTSIDLPLITGSKRVTYTQEELDDLRALGFSNDAIFRLVRLAGITNQDGIRPGTAGDTLNVAPLAALVRYFGGGAEFAAFNQSQQDIAQLEQRLGLSPGEWGRMSAEERREFRERMERGSRNVQGIPVSDPRTDLVDQLESLTRAQGVRESRGQLPGILAADNNFRRGMEAYRGDQLLAFVYSIDPALAQRVAATGGDPEKLDWQDNARVYDILEQGGVIEGSNVRLRQLESATGFFGYFATGGGGGGGGAGPVRRIVDPVLVREQVQQMWSRMFLADVSEEVVQAVVADLQRQLDQAPDGMSFDVSSRIMAFLRGQDVYNELYRNKPAGMAEEEYQAQFAAGVADMIGNELDPEALKAGMRAGDYNTAVGRAAASDKLLTSSTLRGRWAQAKQTLDRFT